MALLCSETSHAPTAPGFGGVTCFPLFSLSSPTHKLPAFPPLISFPSACPYSLFKVFLFQEPPSNNSLESCSQMPKTNALNFLNLPFVKISVKMLKVSNNALIGLARPKMPQGAGTPGMGTLDFSLPSFPSQTPASGAGAETVG